MISVVLFEDNRNLRESLALYLSSSENILLYGAFPDASDSLKLIKKHQPDIVLMDIQMPYISGIDAMKIIKQHYPNIKVLIQTIHEDHDKIFAAICAGADGYIIKNPKPETYLQALQDVFLSGSHLSPAIAAKVLEMFQQKMHQPDVQDVQLTTREKEILQCMVNGMSYKMVADACEISYHTVHTHVKKIYEKLHVNSAQEAVVKALAWKLV